MVIFKRDARTGEVGGVDVLSLQRGYAREYVGRELQQNLPSGEARLREIFERFDSSGDGRLDHLELKLAIRLTAGDEVPLADCERIVRALDTDGNGALDMGEFEAAIKGRIFAAFFPGSDELDFAGQIQKVQALIAQGKRQ